MAERRASVRSADGTEIGFAVAGSGPALVLVHGTTADHTRWRPVIEPLAERFTVYAMDRRGRGLSGDAPAYDIEREYEDVAAVLAAAGPRPRLLGHSYGALCSIEAALRVEVEALVLYEPPFSMGEPLADPAVLARVESLVAAGDADGAVATFMREVAQVPEPALAQLRSLPAWQARIAAARTLAREQRVNIVLPPLAGRFEALCARTLLLLGGESGPMFSEPIRLLEKVLPDATVAVMAGQQHAAMDTGTQLFLDPVLRFLAP